MDDKERNALERAVFVDVREHLKALRSEDLRRLDERFIAQERAANLVAKELERRLDVLNHAHEQARQKEQDFISREVFDNHVERNLNDHNNQRQDVAASAKVLAEKVEASATALAHALTEAQKGFNERLTKVENAQAKILGGLVLATFIAPLISGLIVYLLTK